MTRRSPKLEFRLLGPLEVWRDGRPVRLGGERQRALLALLLLHANEVVSNDRLIEELFGDNASETAANALQVGISRLRRVLGNGATTNGDGGGVVVTRSPGYVLHADPDELDVALFERLVAQGRQELARGDPLVASATLRDALALWRGPPLADLASLEFAQAEIRRLEEMRLSAVMDRVEADLAVGGAGELVPELEALVAANPFQERLRGELMLALYRSGRQAEALELYRQTRELLRDELGLEPSKALQELERSMLRQEATLDVQPVAAPAEPVEPQRPRARPSQRSPWKRRLVAAAAVVAAAVVISVAVALTQGSQAPVVVKPNSIVRVDPETNEVVQAIPVGRHPSGLTATSDAVWVANDRDRTVSRVDVETGEVETIGGLSGVGFLTRDERGNIYASGWDYPYVWRIDPKKVEVARRYRVRSKAVGLAVGGGSLWVVDRFVNAVTRIDLARGTVEGSIPVGFDPLVATFGYGALWVANSDDATVSVIRPGVDRVETIDVREKPFGIAAGEGAVWVGSNDWGTVTRIDPDTRRVVRHISVGVVPTGLYSVVVGAGSVWIPDWLGNSLIRLDPRTNNVIARIKLAASPRDVAIVGDEVWVSVVKPGEDYP